MDSEDARVARLTAFESLAVRGSAWRHELEEALWGPEPVTSADARDLLGRLHAAVSFHRALLDAPPAQRFGRMYDALRWGPPAVSSLAERWGEDFARGRGSWVRAVRPLAVQPTDWPHRPLPGASALLAARAPVALLAVRDGHQAWTLGARALGPWSEGVPLALSEDGGFAVVERGGHLVGRDVPGDVRWSLAPRGAPWRVAGIVGGRVYACSRGEVAIVDRATGALRACAPGLADPRGVLPVGGGALVWGRDAVLRFDPEGAAAVASWRPPRSELNDVCVDARGSVFVSSSGGGLVCLRASDLTVCWESSEAPAGAVSCSSDGGRLVVTRGPFDPVVAVVLGGADGGVVCELHRRGAAQPAAMAPSGARVFAAGSLWDAETGEHLAALAGPGGLALCVSWSADEGWLVGRGPGGFAAWDLSACAPRPPRREGTARGSVVVAGRELLCNGDGRCERWSLDGAFLGDFEGRVDEVCARHGTALRRRPLGPAFEDGEALSLWRVATGATVDLGVGRAPPIHAAEVFVLQRPEGGQEVVSARDGAPRYRLRARHVSAVGAGRWLACDEAEGVSLRATDDGAEILCLGPRGLAAVSWNGETAVTDARTGEAIATLPCELIALDGGDEGVVFACAAGPEIYALGVPAGDPRGRCG